MAYIMQGDEYGIPIYLEKLDGTPVTPSSVQDVEVVIGNIRKTYADNEITFDGNDWIYPLKQEESFLFRRSVRCQVRVKFSDGDVVGEFVDSIDVEPSDSRVKL